MTRAPANSASLAEQAYVMLEQELVTLSLAPGMALREKELEELSGFGRTPVREAVQRLASQGLLLVLPRKGLVVAPVLRSELSQIVEVRRVLERLMVVKAAERASPDQRQALKALAAHLNNLSGDMDAFFRIDRRLDELLTSACGNRQLVAALGPMHSHCRRLWYMSRHNLDLGSAIEMHAALASSVADGDGAGAARALNGIITVLEEQIAELDTLS